MAGSKYDLEQLRLAARMHVAGAKWAAIAARVGACSGDAIEAAVRRQRDRIDLDGQGLGWALLVQDWRTHRIGAPEPPAAVEIFTSKAEALEAKRAREREAEVLLAVRSVAAIHEQRQRARELA